MLAPILYAPQPPKPPAPGASGGLAQIYNIFQGEPDVVPNATKNESYPDWLWKLLDPKKSYTELTRMFVYGKGIKEAKYTDYKRFQRLHRKILIRLSNQRLKKKHVVKPSDSLSPT